MHKYTFKEIVSKCKVVRNIKEGEKVEAACPVCGSLKLRTRKTSRMP